jgi:hypothetical protein
VGYDCSNTQEDELLFGSSFISTLNDTWLATNPIDPHNLAFIVGTNGINSLLLECGGESQGCTDGLVDISSAVLPIPPPPLLDISGQMIRYVPYKHASDLLPPSTYAIEAPTNDQHLTFRLVRDFLQSGSLPTQSSLGYLPPHLRGDSSRYEGLLLLGLTNGNTGLPLANANAPRLTFTPVQAKSAYANFLNSDSGALTVWGLAAQTYTDVNIEVDPSGKARKIDGDVVNVSINTARPTVIGSVVLK